MSDKYEIINGKYYRILGPDETILATDLHAMPAKIGKYGPWRSPTISVGSTPAGWAPIAYARCCPRPQDLDSANKDTRPQDLYYELRDLRTNFQMLLGMVEDQLSDEDYTTFPDVTYVEVLKVKRAMLKMMDKADSIQCEKAK